jgi:hypothetical protein
VETTDRRRCEQFVAVRPDRNVSQDFTQQLMARNENQVVKIKRNGPVQNVFIRIIHLRKYSGVSRYR